MVLGKLSILLGTSPVLSSEINDPRFFNYKSGSFVNELTTITFGWSKKLSEEQKSSYYQSLTHAVMYAENGERVEWYKGDAGGFAVPVMTWPTGDGYCRRMYVQAIAYNIEKNMAATACFSNASTNWRWVAQ
jgi:surface antigen